jgi:hypothetical protein
MILPPFQPASSLNLVYQSDRVKENAAAEFDSLVQRNELSLAAFRDELKSQISEALDLEIKVMRAEILSKSFCSAVGMVSIALGLHRHLNLTQARTLALHTIERNHEQLFKWTESTPESFGKTFKTATDDLLPAHVFGTLDKEDHCGTVTLHISPYPRSKAFLSNRGMTI